MQLTTFPQLEIHDLVRTLSTLSTRKTFELKELHSTSFPSLVSPAQVLLSCCFLLEVTGSVQQHRANDESQRCNHKTSLTASIRCLDETASGEVVASADKDHLDLLSQVHKHMLTILLLAYCQRRLSGWLSTKQRSVGRVLFLFLRRTDTGSAVISAVF